MSGHSFWILRSILQLKMCFWRDQQSELQIQLPIKNVVTRVPIFEQCHVLELDLVDTPQEL